MATELKTTPDRMVFRKTNAQVGRHISVTPENSTNRHLCYGRIILKDNVNSVSINTGERETSFIVLTGTLKVDVNGETIPLETYDALYVPRDCSLRLSTEGSADVAEFSAEVA